MRKMRALRRYLNRWFAIERKIMKRRTLGRLLGASLSLVLLAGSPFVRAAEEAPDAMIKRVSAEVLDASRELHAHDRFRRGPQLAPGDV
jgi:hypothetical protein